MKESHAKGLASHGNPESCAGTREGAGEALTGAHTGGVLSRENRRNQGATLLSYAEGNMRVRAKASPLATLRSRRPPARVETRCARTGRSPFCLLEMEQEDTLGRSTTAIQR